MHTEQYLRQSKAAVDNKLEEIIRSSRPRTPERHAESERLLREGAELAGLITVEREKRYRATWSKAYRLGLDRLAADERALMNEHRDMGVGPSGAAYPGSGGSYLVPVEFYDSVTSKMKFAGPMMGLATVVDSPNARPQAFPLDSDVAVAGEFLSEDMQASAADISGVNQTMLAGYIVSSKVVLASISFAQDQFSNFDEYLAQTFAKRVSRAVEPTFATGSGSGQPTGWANVATVAATAVGANANDGTSAANSIGLADITALEASVDVAYRRSPACRFMMAPGTLQHLRQQLDKQGRPLFPGLHSGGEDTILNYQIALSPAMDTLQLTSSSPVVNRKVLAFGDWSRYTIKRSAPTLLRLVERYIDFAKYGYLWLQRFDGNLLDLNAVKILQATY